MQQLTSWDFQSTSLRSYGFLHIHHHQENGTVELEMFFFQKSRNDSKLGKVYEEKIEMYNSYYKKDTLCNVPRTSTTHTGCLR